MSRILFILLSVLAVIKHVNSFNFENGIESRLLKRTLLETTEEPDEEYEGTESMDDEENNNDNDATESPDSPESSGDNEDDSEEYDPTQTPNSDSDETDNDSNEESSDDSLFSSTDSSCNDILILGDGWTIDGTSISGEYSQNSDQQYILKIGDGNDRIMFEETDNNDYKLIIGKKNNEDSQIAYVTLVSSWTNSNNPLTNGNNAENWSNVNGDTSFTVGDITLQDCNGNDLGTDLCDDNNEPLFNFYSCDTDGNPTSSQQSIGIMKGGNYIIWTSIIAFVGALIYS